MMVTILVWDLWFWIELGGHGFCNEFRVFFYLIVGMD